MIRSTYSRVNTKIVTISRTPRARRVAEERSGTVSSEKVTMPSRMKACIVRSKLRERRVGCAGAIIARSHETSM